MSADPKTTRIGELEEQVARLRLLLGQRDAPGELRHRLRSTLALLRTLIRKSAETDRDLPDYVAHLEDRLDAIARAQAIADTHGEVGLHGLLVDEMHRYQAIEGERLTLSGPDARLQPRAGQVLALAVHELAVNSVEHGSVGAGDGHVVIAWSVAETERGSILTLTWEEAGSAAAAAEPSRSGFGHEVLTTMLAYELEAETELTFGSDGFRCSVRLPFPETVGRIATP